MLGDSDAMVRIGRLYELGKGVEKRSAGKALEFYRGRGRSGQIRFGNARYGYGIYRDGLERPERISQRPGTGLRRPQKKGDVLSDVTVAFCCLDRYRRRSRTRSGRSPS